MSDKPIVSVVLPVYNRGRLVGEAIQSILNQTFQDLELIVVDDGSTDNTPAVLGAFDDSRLRIVRMPVNLGAASARDVGIACAKGNYIATMDSDDVALPHRLALQVDYMQQNPGVTVLATDAIKVYSGRRMRMDYPETDGAIKAMLLWVDGAMIHPTTLIRRQFLLDHGVRYYAKFRTDEDHCLYAEAMVQGARFYNLNIPLLHYRRHTGNVTLDPLLHARKRPIRELVARRFFPDLTTREIDALVALLQPQKPLPVSQSILGLAAMSKAMTENQSHFGEDRVVINRILSRASDAVLKALRQPHRQPAGRAGR